MIGGRGGGRGYGIWVDKEQVYGDGRVRWLFWVDVRGEWKGGFVWVGEGGSGRLCLSGCVKDKKAPRD